MDPPPRVNSIREFYKIEDVLELVYGGDNVKKERKPNNNKIYMLQKKRASIIC